MSSDLHSGATGTSFPPAQRKVAIAEIILFSLVHLVQIPARYMQEWRHWHHNKRQHPARCFVHSWWSMIGSLAQIRIVSSAMMLSTSSPSSAMLIAESVMQSIGLSLLLLEVNLVFLRCGQAGEYGPRSSRYLGTMRFMMHFFWFQMFVAIIIANVGACTDSLPLKRTGALILLATFAIVGGLVIWLVMGTRSIFPVTGPRTVVLTLFTLPALFIRIVYFLQLVYYPSRLRPASGDDDIRAAMSLTPELLIVIALLLARAVTEPISPDESTEIVGVKDEETAA